MSPYCLTPVPADIVVGGDSVLEVGIVVAGDIADIAEGYIVEGVELEGIQLGIFDWLEVAAAVVPEGNPFRGAAAAAGTEYCMDVVSERRWRSWSGRAPNRRPQRRMDRQSWERASSRYRWWSMGHTAIVGKPLATSYQMAPRTMECQFAEGAVDSHPYSQHLAKVHSRWVVVAAAVEGMDFHHIPVET